MYMEYDDYVGEEEFDSIHTHKLENLRDLFRHLALHVNTEPEKIDMSEVDACVVEMAAILGVKIEERVN